MSETVSERPAVAGNDSKLPIGVLIRAFAIPIIMLGAYFVTRALGFQPEIEINGLSDLIRDMFLMFGCSVTYLLHMMQLDGVGEEREKTHFWLLSCLLLLLLFFDDVLMLHEGFGAYFGISDKVLLLINGALLGILLLSYRKRLIAEFWAFIVVFGVLSVGAILLDNTATYWNVAGREIDLEQILEVFALLALSSAYGVQAIEELRR